MVFSIRWMTGGPVPVDLLRKRPLVLSEAPGPCLTSVDGLRLAGLEIPWGASPGWRL